MADINMENTDAVEETVAEENTEAEANGTDAEAEASQAETEEAAEADTAEAEEEQPKKKDRKSRKFQKELEKKDEALAELMDKYKRSVAEFDNYRKRTEKEKAVRYDDGAMGVLVKILPVVDNFERGLAQVTEENQNDPFVEGMNQIYKQLMKSLEDIGVQPMNAEGQEFDPNFHNAVMHVDDEALGENVVAEELQKGYMYKDSVLRYSMVKVAN